ncbi:hypothetical protein [Streptomyces sp. H27-D2]|uniref:hypothetical protein n=1 Tax=Streptomyces sp. H27-D2 TaxID=3046304 RepID=UPI002DB7FB46|nr:hypothetical protein [Streptomyces sp. H27-D2]MEC4020516.1 hypothetical protein [Streptomyces sp. H27-D2]
MLCPHCRTLMTPPPPGAPDRHACTTCLRVAATGEDAQDIEAREDQRREALALLDEALALQRTRRT